MDITTVGTYVAITIFCYVVGMGCKASKKVKDEWIPVIMAGVGCMLGIVGMFVIPDFPAADIINAAAVGIASGLAATGANQLYKQLSK